jgi:hypothetical protein
MPQTDPGRDGIPSKGQRVDPGSIQTMLEGTQDTTVGLSASQRDHTAMRLGITITPRQAHGIYNLSNTEWFKAKLYPIASW